MRIDKRVLILNRLNTKAVWHRQVSDKAETLWSSWQCWSYRGRCQESQQGFFAASRHLEWHLSENSPEPKIFTVDIHLRAEGRETQGCEEASLVGLCNLVFTYDNYSSLSKLFSSNEGFPVPLAKHSALVSDNVFSIKFGWGVIWLSQVSEWHLTQFWFICLLRFSVLLSVFSSKV